MYASATRRRDTKAISKQLFSYATKISRLVRQTQMLNRSQRPRIRSVQNRKCD